MIIDGCATNSSFPANAWGEVEATKHCQRTGEAVVGVRDGRIYTAATRELEALRLARDPIDALERELAARPV